MTRFFAFPDFTGFFVDFPEFSILSPIWEKFWKNSKNSVKSGNKNSPARQNPLTNSTIIGRKEAIVNKKGPIVIDLRDVEAEWRSERGGSERGGGEEGEGSEWKDEGDYSPEYQSYLKSDSWRELRDAVWKRAKSRCEMCGRKLAKGEGQVHHLTYLRFKHERASDLMLLCDSCHKNVHWDKGLGLVLPGWHVVQIQFAHDCTGVRGYPRLSVQAVIVGREGETGTRGVREVGRRVLWSVAKAGKGARYAEWFAAALGLSLDNLDEAHVVGRRLLVLVKHTSWKGRKMAMVEGWARLEVAEGVKGLGVGGLEIAEA